MRWRTGAERNGLNFFREARLFENDHVTGRNLLASEFGAKDNTFDDYTPVCLWNNKRLQEAIALTLTFNLTPRSVVVELKERPSYDNFVRSSRAQFRKLYSGNGKKKGISNNPNSRRTRCSSIPSFAKKKMHLAMLSEKGICGHASDNHLALREITCAAPILQFPPLKSPLL